jgi:hypothetical protein
VKPLEWSCYPRTKYSSTGLNRAASVKTAPHQLHQTRGRARQESDAAGPDPTVAGRDPVNPYPARIISRAHGGAAGGVGPTPRPPTLPSSSNVDVCSIRATMLFR